MADAVAPDASVLRWSCLNCTASRKRCETEAPPRTCRRCARLKLECVFEVAKKKTAGGRGAGDPIGGAVAAARWAKRHAPGFVHPSRLPRRPRAESRSESPPGTPGRTVAVKHEPEDEGLAGWRAGTGLPANLFPGVDGSPGQHVFLPSEAAPGRVDSLRALNFVASLGLAGASNFPGPSDSPLAPATFMALAPPWGAPFPLNLPVPTPNLPVPIPVARVPALPDGGTSLGLVFTSYLRLYVSFPQLIRSELLAEIDAGVLPDYVFYSVAFWALWWDKELGRTLGPELHRALLRAAFDRVQLTLMPALEATLQGYDNLFPLGTDWGPRADEYKRTAVYVVASLAHLLSVASSFSSPTADPFSDFRTVLTLAVRTARAAALNREDLYGGGRGRRAPALLERARRSWWILALMDRQLAIMYHGEPLIALDESAGMGLHTTDQLYEASKAAPLEEVKTEPPPTPAPAARPPASPFQPPAAPIMGRRGSTISSPTSAVAASELAHLYPFSGASAAMLSAVLRSATVTGPHSPTSASPPRTEDRTRIPWQLTTSLDRTGVFDPVAAYVRVTSFCERAVRHRRLHPAAPYADSPARHGLLAEMASWWEELPPMIKNLDTRVLRLHGFTRDAEWDREDGMMGHLAYPLMMFHSAQVLLSSPGEGELWSSEVSYEWLASPAFLIVRSIAVPFPSARCSPSPRF
ncbi:hypothetical protein DFJ74DRAFT_671455 [Hyaloraphidium curvatum]|nr:hypothetical protein DFJ74DRAFT_671455 [Hyaloraphidium curvatum]